MIGQNLAIMTANSEHPIIALTIVIRDCQLPTPEPAFVNGHS